MTAVFIRGVALLYLVQTLTCFTEAFVRDWSYLGCYKDTGGDRDLPYLTNIGGGNSVSSCIDHCYAAGYSYAGLQATTWCTCGDSYGKHGRVGHSQCDHACPGGPGNCGAGWRNSIYRTEAPAGRYLGCFKDTGDNRDLPLLTNNGNQNSISACIKSCSVTGYKYAGLQASTWCTCGNLYGKHGRAPNSECNLGCSAAPGVKCGGGLRNSVYEISQE